MTNDEWREIESKLHKAAGNKVNPQSWGILRSNKVLDWINEGFDVDLDIVPAIEREARNWGFQQINNWGAFKGAVRSQHHRRMRQKTCPSPYVDSKGFNTDDVPLDPRPVRKRAVAEWERIREQMNKEC